MPCDIPVHMKFQKEEQVGWLCRSVYLTQSKWLNEQRESDLDSDLITGALWDLFLPEKVVSQTAVLLWVFNHSVSLSLHTLSLNTPGLSWQHWELDVCSSKTTLSSPGASNPAVSSPLCAQKPFLMEGSSILVGTQFDPRPFSEGHY